MPYLLSRTFVSPHSFVKVDSPFSVPAFYLKQYFLKFYFSLFADFANVFAYLVVFWFDFEHANKISMHPKGS